MLFIVQNGPAVSLWRGLDYKNTFRMNEDLTAKDYEEPTKGVIE